MNIVNIKAAARKALIAASPDYHAWPQTQQEQFRATMDDAVNNRVDAVLLNKLLGIKCNSENADEIWRDVLPSELNHLNWAKLLTTGIGDDMIFLNESMAEGISLLDFNTLYDYDYDDHLFQERVNKEEFPSYQARDYYALRFSRWARLIIDKRFYYANLYSLAGYLTGQLEDKSPDIMQTLIPHEYVEGNKHGNPEESGFLWDIQVDAAGLEKQLDELNSRWIQYSQQRWLELSQTFIQSAPAVYMIDGHNLDELHCDFIFNNESALKQIRWRHFLADCETIKADNTEVSDWEKQELAMAKTWLEATYQDIMENFDLDVIRLEKKRKVVIAPGALDGLLGEDVE